MATLTTNQTVAAQVADALSVSTTDSMAQAVKRVLSGRPEGRTDKGGRWFPAASEGCSCCSSIRTPSRSWPWSLYKHCHSIGHVASRFDVDASALRRAVKAAQH